MSWLDSAITDAQFAAACAVLILIVWEVRS